MEKYVVNGTGFEIEPQDLEVFLQKYPNAVKYEEPGKTTDSAIADPTAESNVMGSESVNGSLGSLENLSQEERQILSDEAFSIKSRRTASGDAVKGSMGAVYADNTVNIIKSLFTDKKEREEIYTGFGNIVDEKANNLYNTFTKTIPAEIARIYKDVAFDDLYNEEELEYLKKQNPDASYEDPSGDPTGFKTNADRIKYLEGYKNTSAAKQEEKINKFVTKKYKEVEIYNKYLRPDTGEGIVKGVKQGDASDVVLGVFNAGASMVETVVPAMLTSGVSLPFQITAPMLMDYNQQKAERIYGKDDPNAVAKLLQNKEDETAVPGALGLIASGFEYVGYKGITNYMLGKAAKGTVARLALTGNKEGITELGQSGIEEVNNALAQGKEGLDVAKAFIDGVFSEKGLESYLQGFIGGTSMSAGGRAINRALRSDNASVKELNGLVNNLAELNVAKNSATNPTAKEAIEVEIKEAELALKKYIKEKRKIADILNEDQKENLINAIDEKDNITSKIESLKNQLNNNEISSKEFGYAIRGLNNQNKRLTEQIELINESAKEQLLQTGLEATKEEGEKVGLKQKLFETKEQYAALFGRKGSKKYKEALSADGHISDDGKTYFVNMQTAREAGAIGVGSHELLHGIIGKSFSKLSTEAKKKLNKNFLNLLSKKDKETVLSRLAGAYGITGDDVFTTEELYTAFSDEIIDGGVKFSKGPFGKIANAFEEILRQLSSAGYFGKESFLYRKEFDNARQAYNFVKDYSLTIKKTGKVTERAKEFAKVDPGAEGKRESRSTVNLDKGEGDISQKIDALTEGAKTKAEFQKPQGPFDNVYSGMIEGKFDRIFGENISLEQKEIQRQNLADRLMNYDPAKTPELSKWIYGGSGKAGNVVYAGLVAKKKLFEEGEARKKTTTIDTKEAKELEDTTPTETTVTDKKDVKLRKLKDFNVELNSGLADALTIAEVNSLLDQYSNGKITFEQAKTKIEELVAKDIRAELSKVMPGIAKNKKTGKVEPTPEYESFIRNEYNEVVQSLGIKTIRTAYKKWFKQEKTGKKNYKNIDPVTGKVSNFIKDTQTNTTNKREYIRWFLEGKPNDLRERRTALIRRIAKRKASLAIDNYIAENSDNIEAKILSFMSTLSDSAENAANEQVSFDSVKFSRSLNKNDARINSDMETKGFYKAPDGTTMTFAKRKNGTWDKGRVFEQAMNETLQEVVKNIKGVSISGEVATEEGGRADIVIEYTDGTKLKVENHEIKKGLSAFMGSVLISELNLQNGKYTLANSIHNNIKGLDGLIKDVVKNLKEKVKSVNNEIDIYNEKYGYKKGDVEFADQITGNVIKGNPESMPLEVYDKVGKELGTLKAGVEVIANHYKGKTIKIDGKKIKAPVKSISLFGYGSFRIDPSSIFKGLPMLDVATEVYASIRYGKRETKGSKDFVTFKPGLQFRLDGKPKNESNSGLYTEQAVMQALNMPAFSKNVGKAKVLDSAVRASRTAMPTKGITVLDFDDTLATTKSLVKYTRPDGTTGTLNAEEYASTYEDLLDQGFTFDFSDFNKVVKGKIAPLFNKAIKLQGKFGPENMFVLTARPPQAAKAIFDFLKANGLNIPIKNITGLGNSTAEAKALWIADKVGNGYNDFYFADDALQNVQAVKNMLDQFDVKSKVQQAKVKFSKSMNDQFNNILEDVTGIEAKKRFSAIKGRKRGESKGKFRVFIPPSHEDFVGLLYNFLGKGKEGNAHRDFFEQALIRPLNRANREYDTARQSVANDYKALNKQFVDVRKKLTKKTPDGDFTFQDAIRVYLWGKHGHSIPGLSPTDQQNLVDLVMQDSELQTYAETINVISKQDTYVTPTDGWNSGDIRMDLDDATGRIGRQQFFAEFIENAEVIFSEENLNKIEAGYGKGVRESLEDMLYRIKTGRNRPSGQNEQVNKLMNYLNGSVGTVMFFNMRSALLQQMSIVNYINFADNNIFAAAKAFANQKQYWKDFAFIFNSDMLKQRRGGIQTDVNGAELAASLRNSKDITRKLISKLLELGFLPTQIGDNIAIATGGAAYYRNRINTYLKQGLSQKEAEAKAFTDFQDITQSTQQSARPDMVSKQQASVIGKVILNFQNVTSQFNRLGKKAFQDIYNRRITKPNSTQMQSDISNAARITYYFAIQNAIFYTLQTALFAMMFDDDEEDDNKLFLKKKERLINGSIDSVLRGSGLIGGVVATLKNVAIAFARQRDVRYNPDESAVGLEALNLSPVLGIKFRKIVNAEKTLNYNKKVIKEMETFDIDNPQWSAATNYVEAFTNVPLNRLYNKTQNVRQALNNEHSAWERSLMFLGWSQYNLDLENKKMEDIKNKTKSKKRKFKGIKPKFKIK